MLLQGEGQLPRPNLGLRTRLPTAHGDEVVVADGELRDPPSEGKAQLRSPAGPGLLEGPAVTSRREPRRGHHVPRGLEASLRPVQQERVAAVRGAHRAAGDQHRHDSTRPRRLRQQPLCDLRQGPWPAGRRRHGEPLQIGGELRPLGGRGLEHQAGGSRGHDLPHVRGVAAAERLAQPHGVQPVQLPGRRVGDEHALHGRLQEGVGAPPRHDDAALLQGGQQAGGGPPVAAAADQEHRDGSPCRLHAGKLALEGLDHLRTAHGAADDVGLPGRHGDELVVPHGDLRQPQPEGAGQRGDAAVLGLVQGLCVARGREETAAHRVAGALQAHLGLLQHVQVPPSHGAQRT
mmetsp:Transcript_26118/g.78079  ORF Transcript_26118/g.78079 Transcript_26118/m.78079 type:complete len:347 (-) Transcript_26118:170-1210(-)